MTENVAQRTIGGERRLGSTQLCAVERIQAGFAGIAVLLGELAVKALGPYEIFHQTEKNLRIYLFHPKAGA